MRLLIAVGILALVSAGALVAAYRGGGEAAPAEDRYRGSEPPPGVALPDFELEDEAGKLVGSRDLRGMVVVLTFLDSQCTESCPLIASQIARTVDRLTPAERRDVVALAISTDPAEDTAASVREFLRRHRALGKLRYVGGGQPVETLRAVWRGFGILSSLESGEDTLHSAPVRVYDRHGIWVSTLHAGADLTPGDLAHDIRAGLEQ